MSAPRDIQTFTHSSPPKRSLVANVKHKRWLKELSKLKGQLAVEQERRQRKLEKRRRNLAARLARERELIRETTTAVKQEDDPSETQSSTPQVAHDMRDDSAAAAVDEIVSSVPTKQKRKRHRKKPLWAMTAEEVQQQEQQEDEDAADLIEFASSLDYEKYIEDSEVQAALRVLLNRVCELEQKNDTENKSDQQTSGDTQNGEPSQTAEGDESGWRKKFVTAWNELAEDQRSVLRKHLTKAPPSNDDLASLEQGWDSHHAQHVPSNLQQALHTFRSVHSRSSIMSLAKFTKNTQNT